ncbi:putative ribosomal protein S4/S9 [Helianthus annuus]|nr:putative ribosomal protein S4/S9 [Helianthus annuus]
MSRYRGPRFKKIRRLGALPGLTNKRPRAGSDLRNQSRSGKKSQHRIRLEEKQKLRFHYGLTERQLLKYVRIAGKAKGSTGQVLLQLLEMRLDNILFRLGMAPTNIPCLHIGSRTGSEGSKTANSYRAIEPAEPATKAVCII